MGLILFSLPLCSSIDLSGFTLDLHQYERKIKLSVSALWTRFSYQFHQVMVPIHLMPAEPRLQTLAKRVCQERGTISLQARLHCLGSYEALSRFKGVVPIRYSCSCKYKGCTLPAPTGWYLAPYVCSTHKHFYKHRLC